MTVAGQGQAGGRQRARALISGASFAGLASAWWLDRAGYAVTVAEIAPGLRKGGTPVDIRDEVVGVVERMGLLEAIGRRALPPRTAEFLDMAGVVHGEQAVMEGDAGDPRGAGWEIERDELLDLLYRRVEGRVEFRFAESVAGIEEVDGGVEVRFASGGRERYGLVLGCDGAHSGVRRLWFGPESEFVRFLGIYFGLSILPKLLFEENVTKMVQTDGRAIMLNTYNGKTDIGLAFRSEVPISYDRRDTAQQRRMIREQFAGAGWRVPELLGEMESCDNFYFDKLCQVRMPAWAKGRVVLVGDAGYCPSPAAGLGGSIALMGAAALGEAMERFPGDYREAFAEYERSFRPTVERIQAGAVEMAGHMCQALTPEVLAAWGVGE